MAETRIEWADAVWNVTSGCSPVSEGCQNCWAKRYAHRLRGRFGYPADDPFRVTLHPERLKEPLRWSKPRRVFVCSMGDLFHPEVPETFIAQVLHEMCWRPEHTFLVLTKRPDRMAELLCGSRFRDLLAKQFLYRIEEYVSIYHPRRNWPLPNLWLGVTAENQARADERIPILLQIPAAVRWVSCEPLLGPIDLHDYLWNHHDGTAAGYPVAWAEKGGIHWVVVGGETGPGARPCHPDWIRRIRDDCVAARVPFFLKHLGEYITAYDAGFRVDERDRWGRELGAAWAKSKPEWRCCAQMVHVGRRAAGRLLDGREWNEMPGVSASSSAE